MIAPVPSAVAGATVRTRRPAVFIDKDGTLVENVPHNVDPALLRLTPHALEGLSLLQQRGYALVVVTNQPGIALGLFDRAALVRLEGALVALLRQGGVMLDGFYACPHAPGDTPLAAGCPCRKPAPGLLRQAAVALALDLDRSWMVGDILDDVEAGARAGCRSILLDVGNETVWRRSPLRTPTSVQPDLLAAARHIVEGADRPPEAIAGGLGTAFEANGAAAGAVDQRDDAIDTSPPASAAPGNALHDGKRLTFAMPILLSHKAKSPRPRLRPWASLVLPSRAA